MDKAYVGTMKLGERTPSQDADTAPDATFPWEGIADDELRDAAAKLVGDLKQARLVPPVVTPVPIRPRSRGERRSLSTFPVASLRPPLAFNPRPRRLSTPLLKPFNSTPTSVASRGRRPSAASDVQRDQGEREAAVRVREEGRGRGAENKRRARRRVRGGARRDEQAVGALQGGVRQRDVRAHARARPRRVVGKRRASHRAAARARGGVRRGRRVDDRHAERRVRADGRGGGGREGGGGGGGGREVARRMR
eukprot:31387-Pelagococcus_subviridis.AAC.2